MDWGKFGLGKRNVFWISIYVILDGYVYYFGCIFKICVYFNVVNYLMLK